MAQQNVLVIGSGTSSWQMEKTSGKDTKQINTLNKDTKACIRPRHPLLLSHPRTDSALLLVIHCVGKLSLVTLLDISLLCFPFGPPFLVTKVHNIKIQS